MRKKFQPGYSIGALNSRQHVNKVALDFVGSCVPNAIT